MKDIESFRPDLVLQKYAPQMLVETVANEMDPNLIVLRLGKHMSKEDLLDKSLSIGSVSHGDTFGVSFRRANFGTKREAQSFTRLNRDTKKDQFQSIAQKITSASTSFDQKFKDTFFKQESEVQNSDPEFVQF